MKAIPTTDDSDEGSTLNVQGQQQQDCEQQQQPQQQQRSSNLIHTIDQKTNNQQAWFHQPTNKQHSLSHNHPTNEALIEAQVLRLTDECRLFQQEEEENDEDETDGSNTNSKSNTKNPGPGPALFHRHEIQTSWNLLGNGAFSEVYTIQKFYMLDGEFVDAKQREARETLQGKCSAGRQKIGGLGQQFLQCEGNSQAQLQSQSEAPQYVIKHLRRDLLTDRKRFIHAAGDLVMEAMYLSKLKHPNIIKLRGCAVGGSSAYGNGKHDGFFLILDRLNSTLSQQIQEWKQCGGQQQQQMIYSNSLVDFREKIEIAHQIASALEYLHGKDIVYRDLKPDNIGLVKNTVNGANGAKTTVTVQLFDFGLCREIPEVAPPEDKVFHMSGVGTRRYMSPEVYLGQHYNVKADVYSWAMVLHSMITLQRPFEMYNSELHKLLVCEEGIRPTIYKEWPQQIQQLLRGGWAAQSSDRPSMKEICSFMEGLFDDGIGIGVQHYNYNCNNEDITTTLHIDTSRSSITDDVHREQSIKKPEEEPATTSAAASSTTANSIACFMEEWTQLLCSGSSYTNNNTNNNNNDAAGTTESKKRRPTKKSLLRTLEAHLMADAAGNQLLMMQDHNNHYYRDKLGTTDYPHLQRLRSSYL